METQTPIQKPSSFYNYDYTRSNDLRHNPYQSILGHNKDPLTSVNPMGWVSAYALSQGKKEQQVLQDLGYNAPEDASNWVRNQGLNFQNEFLGKIGLTDDMAKINFLSQSIIPASQRPENAAAIARDNAITSTSGGTATAAPIYSQSDPKQALLDFQSGKITAEQYNQWAKSYSSGGQTTQPAGQPSTPGAPTQVPTVPGSPGAPTSTPAQPGQPGMQPAGAPAPLLQIGSKGAEVSELQKVLGITTDGIFGPKTQAAVKAFQAAHGLVTDGIVGPKTLAELTRAKSGPTPDVNVGAGVNSNIKNEPGNKDTASNALVSNIPGTNIPRTGDNAIDSLISLFENQSPQKSFTDVYKEIYDSLGLSNMKADYEEQTKAFSDLQEKKREEIEAINDDPWFSEGKRVAEIRRIETKYENKELILQNRLKMLEGSIANGRADAQFIAGQTMDQLQQSSKLSQDIILKAIDIAENLAEAERKPEKTASQPTSVQEYEYAVSQGYKGSFSDYQDEDANRKAAISSKTISPIIKNRFISYGSSLLESSRGSDGYVDPYVYKEAYDGWVNGFIDADGNKVSPIGTASEFTSKFPPKNYVNPQASKIPGLLPTFLQNNPSGTGRTP